MQLTKKIKCYTCNKRFPIPKKDDQYKPYFVCPDCKLKVKKLEKVSILHYKSKEKIPFYKRSITFIMDILAITKIPIKSKTAKRLANWTNDMLFFNSQYRSKYKTGHQFTEEQFNRLYPKRSTKIWSFMHCLNEEDSIARCLDSVKDRAYKIVVGIDDRTTDQTEKIAKKYGAITFKFKWDHSFAEAKNKCLRIGEQNGLNYGDWVLFMGSDFQLKELDMNFITGRNFFGNFRVPEHHERGKQYVSRDRKLLWRHHPAIYWENLVDEEAIYSAYRHTGFGIVFGNAEWKRLPYVGWMWHYGYKEDGEEDGKIFLNKKMYYQVLRAFQRIMNHTNWKLVTDSEVMDSVIRAVYPDGFEEKTVGDLLYRIRTRPELFTENKFIPHDIKLCSVLQRVYNNPKIVEQVGIDKAVNSLVDRMLKGDYPLGLKEYGALFHNRVDHD